MRPVRLYIENFMCYDKSYIDFTQFNSALIVGKAHNNDLFSNGVGKTTIFKAIEYVLFNQSDVTLDRIIRDDMNSCRVVFDFLIKNQEYRISRSRTKKGVTDLILLQRNAALGDILEIYHDSNNNPYYDKKYIEKYWKDLSASRAGDTEKDLEKIIKINAKSFRSTVHFIQNDLSGLPTATPEKRKVILKDALNLIIYSKLEKIAKEKYSIINKEFDKYQILLSNLGKPEQDLISLNESLKSLSIEINKKEKSINIEKEKINQINLIINNLNNDLNSLTKNHLSLINKFQENEIQIKKIEKSLEDFSNKKINIIKSSKDLINDIKQLKIQQQDLIKLDFSKIDEYINNISFYKEEIIKENILITDRLEKCEEKKIPLPKENFCKHCRQILTEEHRQECKDNNEKDLFNFQKEIKISKFNIINLNKKISNIQLLINDLQSSKNKLDSITQIILNKEKEISDSKILHNEYSSFILKLNEEINEKLKEQKKIEKEINKSSQEEANQIKDKIIKNQEILQNYNNNLSSLNKEYTHFNNNKAVVIHNIEQKIKDKNKKEELETSLKSLEKKHNIYPLVIKSFSSTGIPNIIIQNVLDDLQIEANTLLSYLKPGLQVSFSIEKTKDDGTEVDTLDIKYEISGKERYYEQLSGAMRLAITFSLKLGLSFVLQKIIGMNVDFILLDEIDQSLDKASVDAFADMVKLLQKQFLILIITHNDRLKDKFSHAILVEQDLNMISQAKVVTSW